MGSVVKRIDRAAPRVPSFRSSSFRGSRVDSVTRRAHGAIASERDNACPPRRGTTGHRTAKEVLHYETLPRGAAR